MTAAEMTTVQKLLQTGNGGRDLSEYLRELYVDRRLTDQEIAGLLGVHRMTVNTWRKQFGIARSDRKAALT